MMMMMMPLRSRFNRGSNEGLPFTLYTVGTELQQPMTRLRGFSAHQLFFTFGGSGKYRRLGQEKWDILLPNTLLHIPAGIAHEYMPTSEEPWHVGYATYTEKSPGLLSGWSFAVKGAVVYLQRCDKIHELLELLWLMAGRKEEAAEMTAVLFRLCLEIQNESVSEQITPANAPSVETDSTGIRQAVRFMHDYLQRDLSIAQLAAYVGYSPRHFTRMFREQLGTTPGQYLQKLRLKTAATLLNEYPEMTVRQAAAYVGMEPDYFTRMFRRQYGRLPSVRRQRQRG